MEDKKFDEKRYISLNCLFDIINNNVLLHDALNKYRNKFDNKNDDYFLYIERIVKGVLENIEDLNSYIKKYSSVKINKIKPIILIILYQTIYELKYMSNTPNYACINEAIKLVEKYKLHGLKAWTNGVLRNIAREIENETTNETVNVNSKNNELKKDCNILTPQNSKINYVRINDILNQDNIYKKITANNILLSPYKGNLKFDFYKIYECKNIKQLLLEKCFLDGQLTIQDASSIFFVENLYKQILNNNINKKINILDCCAAPGGKSLCLWHLLKKDFETHFECRDKSKIKIDKIKENVKREINDKNIISNNFSINIQDATIENENDYQKYDVVIMDVPCSGLGVVNKKPDILLKQSVEKIDSLQIIQRNIIDAQIKNVKIGGIFSYSTCTTTKEENEDNKNYILNKYKNSKLIIEKQIEINSNDLCDGFYFAIFKMET